METNSNEYQILQGKYELCELKPKIKENKILFPIFAKMEYVEEDGRSFGYPVDDGWVTHVKYDYTVGALTDDTISLIDSMKKPKRPHSGTCPMKTYDWTDKELDAWQKGLDASWAFERFVDWVEKGHVTEDEKDEWIENELENYHCWPQEWRDAYDDHMKKLNKPVGKITLVLKNGPLSLYKDENQDYFFSTEYHNYGKICKAAKQSAEQYIKAFEIYSKELESYQKLNQQLKENLKLLKDSLTNN